MRLFRVSLLVAISLLVAATIATAHDLFLKPQVFFVAPNGTVRVAVLNGTFSSTEGSVSRDRLRDLSVVGVSGRSKIDTTAWTPAGKGTNWVVPVQGAGTYLLGASLLPRTIALKAKDFNSYLASDGLPNILAERKQAGELGADRNERYSKHVKALVQVGDARSDGFGTVLGYPAELVPLNNPYDWRSGGPRVLRVRALVDGTPVPNQVVLAGGRTSSGARLPEQMVRTDAQGIAQLSVSKKGLWYVKFIRMVRVPAAAKDSVDYESKWATLTFAVK